MPNGDDLEKRALKLIIEKGDEGILQRELWHALGATSRAGSRIALQLEAREWITRERELSNRRWTYQIFSNIQPIEIDSIRDIPCTTCEDIEKCEVGTGISAIHCEQLIQWLSTHANTQHKNQNETISF